MTDTEIAERMLELEGWSRDDDTIVKTYRFANYHETMAFVNASAWISHRADHHPDLTVGYNQCTVAYTTHSAGGLTRKDFDCAAKVDALFAS
ncbi:MAG: 4a-hydroxytetrahydrobiopterin dehydratase [Gammaproteobacteria bacterium]|nr:4a-hydroxytetrahydrobiopterin dehydratase [Gammaproteobacteria bacterium]MBU1415258.1 4a-hydroxytetrahydrobiopterin dehydratase [Gammaproteobacteria bacterium]